MRRPARVLIALPVILLAVFVAERSPQGAKNLPTGDLQRARAIPGEKVYTGLCRRVVDGDSLYLAGLDTQIRLWGVDAPERDESGYDAARSKLIDLALQQNLRCLQQDIDKYGRIVARCFRSADSVELNAIQIESGVADEYCHFSRNFYGNCR